MSQGLKTARHSLGQNTAAVLGRRLLALAVLLVVASQIFLGSASAEVTTKKLIWGPFDEKSFDTYQDLGAGLYEFTVNWSDIAPTRPANPTDPADPAYHWTPAVEEIIQHAQAHGIQVVLTVMGAPGWANGGRPWPWAPKNPQDFANFVTAAAKRWPQVHYWQIWGEPTRKANFMPLPHVEGLELTPAQAKAPERYAEILDASYVALKSLSPANIVIGGNTFSGGDIRPLTWIKYLRLPNGRPPRMDMFGQNPFGYRRPDLSQAPLNPTSGVSDFSDLDTLAQYVDRYLSRAGRNPGKLPLFLSEYFVPTDHKNFEFNYWVSQKTAASWLSSGFQIERKWSRIFTLGWFELDDEAPNARGNEVNRGLLTYDGRPKPAYYAFKNG